MAPLELRRPKKVLWISCSDTLLTVRKEVTLSGTNLDWLQPFFKTQEIFYLAMNFKSFYCKEKGRGEKAREEKPLLLWGSRFVQVFPPFLHPLIEMEILAVQPRQVGVRLSGWQETRSVAESFGQSWDLQPGIMVISGTLLLCLVLLWSCNLWSVAAPGPSLSCRLCCSDATVFLL